MVRRAYRAQPLLPTAASVEVDLHAWRREFELATVLGKKAVELHPYLQVARAAYAQALQFSGKLDDALAQYRLTSVMCPDLPWLRALEGTCLAAMGPRPCAPSLDDRQPVRRYLPLPHGVFRCCAGHGRSVRSWSGPVPRIRPRCLR